MQIIVAALVWAVFCSLSSPMVLASMPPNGSAILVTGVALGLSLSP